MTHPTDEDLDEMASDLCHTGELSMPYRCEIADAIKSLRAHLARREEMHDCAMKERDDATLYADEQKARAKALEDALRAARVHVANNAQGWSVGRGASRDDLALVDATLAKIKGADHE